MANGTVHIILGLIFGLVTVAVTALEVYFITPFTQTETLFVCCQNIGIALANSFYVSKVKIGTEGMEQETTGGAVVAA